jgi:protein-disulfide isomerase
LSTQPSVPSRRPPRSRALLIAALLVPGVVLLAAIVVIAIGEDESRIEITGVSDTNPLVGGIAQEGTALGSPDAPVTVQIFNDLQCRDCADYQLEIVPPLVEDYVRPGDARLEFRHFSIGRDNPTTLAAVGAEAAGGQERAWQFIQLMFENIDQVTTDVDDDFLRAIAGSAGLDVAMWDEERSDPDALARVEADAELARVLKLREAAAVRVDGPRGDRLLQDFPSIDEIEAAIAAVS